MQYRAGWLSTEYGFFRHLLLYLAFTIPLILPIPANGQTFVHLSVVDGLSQNTAQTVSQGADGLLYIGTQEGLNVYDGYGFETYKHQPNVPGTLADNYVISTHVDDAGTLWVGTRTALHRFDPLLGRFQPFPLDPALALDSITGITQGSDGKLWLTINGYPGIAVLDPHEDGYIKYREDHSRPSAAIKEFYRHANAIARDQQNRLWVGTNAGLVIYSPDNNIFEHVDYDSNAPLNAKSVNHIRHDAAGDTWLSTDNGLYRLALSGDIKQHFQAGKGDLNISDNLVTATLQTRKGQLWIATHNGLNRYIASEQRIEQIHHNPMVDASLGSNEVIHLFEDHSGELWISTGQTLDRYSTSNNFHYLGNTGSGNTIEGDVVWSLLPSRHEPDILWAVTKTGLYKYRLNTKTLIKHYSNQPGNAFGLPRAWLTAIHEKASGELWLGTRSAGALHFDPKTEIFTHFPHVPDDTTTIASRRIINIVQDQQDQLWFIGFDGISRFDESRDRFIHFDNTQALLGHGKVDIRCAAMGSDNTLWIASAAGIFRLDFKTHQISKYIDNTKNITGHHFWSVHEDSNEQLWVGLSHGIYQWVDTHKRLEPVVLNQDELEGGVISISSDDDGNLWFGQNNGLVRFDPQKKQTTRYNANQGLPVVEYAVGASVFDGKHVYLGGVGGLVYFNPSEMNPTAGDPNDVNYHPPHVIFRDLLIDNKPISASAEPEDHQLDRHINYLDRLSLNYHDQLISIEFAADHYANPGENRFAYRLKGFNDDWIYTRSGQNTVTYTHLPAGNYLLEIKAANPEGVWGPLRQLKVTMKPAPWRTWWAYLAYIIMVSGILAIIWQQRVNKLATERWANQAIQVSQRRYQNFVENSTDGIWRIDLEPPVSTALPANKQIEQICARAKLAEANTSLANMYRKPLEELYLGKIVLINLSNITTALKDWIADGYRVSDQVSTYLLGDQTYWLSSAYTGEIVNDELYRIWGVSREVSEQKLYMESLEYQATHDALTGIKNRHGFYRAAATMIQESEKTGDNIALILLDLNDFKEVNDTLGHEHGDELLRELGRRFQKHLPESSSLYARFGGDEFVFLVSYHKSLDEVHQLNKRILSLVHHPQVINNTKIAIKASIGVALSSKYGRDLNALMRFADIAMYSAKYQNLPISFSDAKDADDLRSKLTLMAQLDDALYDKQFVLYYQTRMDLHTDKMTGCEALIRWHHPKLGLLAPDQFIPIAERTTLIHDLTQWVLNEAFSQWNILYTHLGYKIDMAINLSVYNVQSSGFVPRLKLLLEKHQVDTDFIELEITEGVMMEQREIVIDTLNEIRNLGIKIAIDDFGTGYSSLTYLKDLPVDILKIDKHFCQNLPNDERDKTVVEWIINLAHVHGLKVVAEGVENRPALAFLKTSGCEYAQGYYLSRPLPEDTLAEQFT